MITLLQSKLVVKFRQSYQFFFSIFFVLFWLFHRKGSLRVEFRVDPYTFKIFSPPLVFSEDDTTSRSFLHFCNCMARLPTTKSLTRPFFASSSSHTRISAKCSSSSGEVVVVRASYNQGRRAAQTSGASTPVFSPINLSKLSYFIEM